MIRAVAAAAMILLAGCGGGDHGPAQAGAGAMEGDWQRWHDEKQATDLAVAEAINAPGGGDYAKAAGIIRRSDRPEDVKQFQIGMLVIDGFEQPAARRPPETLEDGLRMVEDAVASGGEMRRAGPQQLRLLFERGAGRAPDAIAIDPSVAACWRRLENGGEGDPRRCVAMRRERSLRAGG